MSAVGLVHGTAVAPRRVRVLARHVAGLIPRDASVLDVGTGDGHLATAVGCLRPDVHIEGIDVLVRSETGIPVSRFDGRHIPRPAASVDVVTLIDVVHHAEDPVGLLAESARVARVCVVLKDHLCESATSRLLLRFMDWTGNAHHGVALPYTYWSAAQWQSALAATGTRATSWHVGPLGLYPWPASAVFERGLHVLACVERV